MKKILSDLNALKERIMYGDYSRMMAVKIIDDINRIMSQIRMIEK